MNRRDERFFSRIGKWCYDYGNINNPVLIPYYYSMYSGYRAYSYNWRIKPLVQLTYDPATLKSFYL